MLSVAVNHLSLSVYEYVQHSPGGVLFLEPAHLCQFLMDCIALVSSILILFDPIYMDNIIKRLGIKELGLLPNYE